MTPGGQAQIGNVDLVKQLNSAAVYRLIDQYGPISRIQIAEINITCLRKSRLRLKMPNPPTAYILLIEVNNETDPPDYR